MTESIDLIDHTAAIVSAYVARTNLPAGELPGLVRAVHEALTTLGAPVETPAPAMAPVKPTAAQIRASVRPDALVSFEDGRSYKTLRRHLGLHGLTPEAYRAKHGLPADYPMTAAAYSARRSVLAKQAGLGRRGRMAAQAAE